eukprot:TRINITY_DN9628_c0_g1_i1.p1 TRINITY_DN9628_c0_g1~~TRINITY_DN9628_c0_g1_i1.p1  ORF type:complete len:355 (+),score=49.81 TRINITY_DN9628_c0_g1_i1:57-1121(+)
MKNFKIAFNGEIRRIPGSFFNLSDWDAFCGQMCNLFRHDMPGIRGGPGPFRLTYLDDEGETVCIMSLEELLFAVSLASVDTVRINVLKKNELKQKRKAERPSTQTGVQTEGMSLLEVLPDTLKEGSAVRLSTSEGDMSSEELIVRVVGNLLVFASKHGCSGNVRIGRTHAGVKTDFRGKLGPAARFAVFTKDGHFAFYNRRMDAYLSVQAGKLVPSLNPALLTVKCVGKQEPKNATEAVADHGLRHNVVVELVSHDGTFCSEKFTVKCLPCETICLVPRSTMCSTLRVHPLSLQVDYRGRGGPFAQFKVVCDGEFRGLLNRKTNTYLTLENGKLAATSMPTALFVLPAQMPQES